MTPWARDIVVCDNFEYMVRRALRSRSHSPPPDHRSHVTNFSRLASRASPRFPPRSSSQETATFATTGGHVWRAAHRLADYLEAVADDIGLSRPGANVLELGAGTGYLAMVLARNLPSAARVVASEMESGGALEWLRRNLRRNEAPPDGAPPPWRPGLLTAVACDWNVYRGDPPASSGYEPRSVPPADTAVSSSSSPRNDAPGIPELDDVPWDLIVGSDLVYDDAGVAALPDVVASLLKRAKIARQKAKAREMMTTTRDDERREAAEAGSPKEATPCDPKKSAPPPAFVYAHTKYRYELRDVDFFANMKRRGLVMREVREPGAPTPPESPERFSSLFPEQRVAVFRVTLAEDGEEEGAEEGAS